MSIICISEQEKWILISKTSKNLQLTMMCTIFAKNNNVLIVQPAKNPTPLLISSTAQTSEPAVIFQILLVTLLIFQARIMRAVQKIIKPEKGCGGWWVFASFSTSEVKKKLYVLYHMQWEQKKKQ